MYAVNSITILLTFQGRCQESDMWITEHAADAYLGLVQADVQDQGWIIFLFCVITYLLLKQKKLFYRKKIEDIILELLVAQSGNKLPRDVFSDFHRPPNL